MLLPKRVKYRKQFRGRMNSAVTRFPMVIMVLLHWSQLGLLTVRLRQPVLL